MWEELVRTADLLVRRVPGGAGRPGCCAVTFDSFTDARTLDRTGFAQAQLHEAGVDAIHVLSRDNCWYQLPETLPAMERVRQATAGYRQVVAYGSSMGAYAAMRLAGVAGAGTVLALSPQFSVRRDVAPWERRWPHASATLPDVWESAVPLPAPGRAFVAFDPLDADRRHVALFAAAMRIERVPIPGVGHPVTGALARAGLLRQALLEVCDGTFDPAAFAADAASRCAALPEVPLARLAALPRWRVRRRLALARQAVALAPGDIAVLARLAVELRRSGLLAEAADAHRRVVAAVPGHPDFLYAQAVTLARMGDRAGAAAAADAVQAHADGSTLYDARLHRLRARLKRPEWLGWLPL